MKFRLLAVLAAIAVMFGIAPSIKMSSSGGVELTTLTSAAYAKGHKGQRIWMAGASREEIVAAFIAGDEPCTGSAKNSTCYNLDPILNELHIQWTSRPDGLNKNVVVNSIISLDSNNVVLRSDNGVVLARFQVGSEQQNAAAIWNTALANVLPAAANGTGAALVSGLMSPCHGSNGCGGGPQVVNMVNASSGSLSNATAGVTAALSGAGCSTGTCGVTTKP